MDGERGSRRADAQRPRPAWMESIWWAAVLLVVGVYWAWNAVAALREGVLLWSAVDALLASMALWAGVQVLRRRRRATSGS